ncbi:DNA-binding CsgD family transcriptional regulator/PAS domain-containing protein [Bradyrhizobium sp. USDA 4341]
MPNFTERADRKTGATGRRPQQAWDLDYLTSYFGELIDAAALNPEAWLQVTEELRRVNPGVRVVIQAHDPSFGRPLVALATGWSDGYVEKYNGRFAYVNEVAKIWSKTAPLLTPVLLPEYVVPISTFLKSEFYNEGLKPEGDADCATGVRILSEGRRQATLAIQYGLRQKDEMHQRLSPLLQLLGPKLRGAFLANRQTVRQKGAAHGATFIDNLVDPALIVDRDRRVIAANRAAQEFIASSEVLRIGARDILSFGEQQKEVQFARLVSACCERAPGSSGYLEFSFAYRGSRLQVSLLPISRGGESVTTGIASLFTPAPGVLLVLRRDLSITNVAEFKSRFRLTSAELRVVQALSQEEGSLVQIADQLGVAYETARYQLKAVLKKTGTHSQRELISLLLQK